MHFLAPVDNIHSIKFQAALCMQVEGGKEIDMLAWIVHVALELIGQGGLGKR